MSGALGHIINKYQDVAPERIIKAVARASDRTGADFSFLMEKAKTESSFNPAAKARTSSATGLFQFIENTWLSMVKKHGEKYGLGDMAEKISFNSDGRACVCDAASRKQILDLRKNPEISALMAGEYSAENKEYLEAKTTCDIGATEMYIAHFMGAGGAAKFLNAREKQGDAVAATLFPDAARANRNIFFDKKTGQPRTLDQIYAIFDRKFSDTPETTATAATMTNTSPKTLLQAQETTAADCGLENLKAYVADTTAPQAAREIAQEILLQTTQKAVSAGNDGIVWFDAPEATAKTAEKRSTSSHSRVAGHGGAQRLSPVNVMTMIELQNPSVIDAAREKQASENRAYYGRHLYNS